ncbi:unnamed protein product, partial [Rotaria sp. Silwood2]
VPDCSVVVAAVVNGVVSIGDVVAVVGDVVGVVVAVVGDVVGVVVVQVDDFVVAIGNVVVSVDNGNVAVAVSCFLGACMANFNTR